MKPHYQIVIKNGKYPQEYQCALFIEVHFFKWLFWYHLKTQRGNLFHICHMADRWSELFKCEIIDKSIEL